MVCGHKLPKTGEKNIFFPRLRELFGIVEMMEL